MSLRIGEGFSDIVTVHGGTLRDEVRGLREVLDAEPPSLCPEHRARQDAQGVHAQLVAEVLIQHEVDGPLHIGKPVPGKSHHDVGHDLHPGVPEQP